MIQNYAKKSSATVSQTYCLKNVFSKPELKLNGRGTKKDTKSFAHFKINFAHFDGLK